MEAKKPILIIILLLTISTVAFGDRELDRTEILQIFKTLTSQPRKTWIPAGTIEATHIAYKTSSGYITDSNVTVKYDGDKFYWEIDINSYTRQTEPQGNHDGKSSRDALDLDWNKKRVFAWDGERYTMYFRSGNSAVITESPSDIPVAVNGPLTAGIVPWGYGMYTYEQLSAAESSAIEVDVNGQKQLHLTFKNTDTPEMVFVLDPAKNYAVLSCSANDVGRSFVTKTYENYQLVSGKWIPATILVERYGNSKQIPELLTQDYWDINSISTAPLQADSFGVEYETDTLVEYYSPVTDKHLSYRYSKDVNTDSLFQDRLAIALSYNTQTQNCATVATKYVASQLGKEVTDQQLAGLVNEPNKDTSLYELKQFAESLGFYCVAVKTDIQTLKNLKNYQVILYLPGTDHYVVIGHINDKYVWIIDLDSNKFYYRTKLDEFSLNWNEGAALLLSNEPLYLNGTFTELNDQEMHEIIGGFPAYSCTELIQEYDIEFCSEPIFGLCGGVYRTYYNRYGCVEDENGGNCSGDALAGNVSSPCIEDPYSPGSCTITGNWYSQYIRACK